MKLLLKIYDNILNSKNSNLTTVAISWLHIVRAKFPGFLENYTLNSKDNIFIFSSIFKLIKRNIIFIFYIFKKNLFYRKKNKQIKNCEILIISHCLNKKSLNMKMDFYFGELERILSQKNFRYFKLLINHTDYDSEKLNDINKIKKQMVLEKYLTLSEELKIFFLQIQEFIRLKIYQFSNKNCTIKKSLNNICNSVFDSQTKFSLRMHFLTHKYLSQTKPKYIIFTYEGFAWERLCINAAKKFSKNIKVIGYQQSFVTKNCFAILRNIKGDYNPDIVWTTGKNSHSILKQSKKLKKVEIKKIGYLKKKNKFKVKLKIEPNILVVPNATFSDNIKLFSFSLKCAKKNKFIYFTWRVHPLVNIKKIFKNLNIDANSLPKNVNVSKNSFVNDIKTNSFVLYIGSAAVIEASSGGNIPIYLNLPREANADPIRNYKQCSLYVNSENQFLELFRDNLMKKKIKKIQSIAPKIIYDFYEKLDKRSLLKTFGD